MSDAPIWRALANPTRRRMLDLLRKQPLTTGSIAKSFPDLSRFAVMQHLSVLEEAGLVLVRRQGRERFNHLNAVPIQEIHERWVSRFAETDAEALLSLRRHLEQEGRDVEQARTIKIESEIRLRATAERVWKAVTDEQQDWYPYNYGGKRLKRIVTEPGVGGRVYEDWGDGAGILYSHVTYWDPPHAIGLRGFLQPAIVLEQWMSLEADGDDTVLKHSTTTFGSITDEMAEGIRTHGELKQFESQLRAWVERGERVSA
jgi:DNA-binding transcriptional ArsR family regulator